MHGTGTERRKSAGGSRDDPLGIAFGLLARHAAPSWWWATVFSSVVFAGSLEFLLVAVVATAVPLAQVALTTVMVDSRHVSYALSFPLHRVSGRLARTYTAPSR